MSVYIKGMEMPKDCWHCPMINNVDECCLLTEEQHDMYEGEMDQVQAAFCPLVEIPPHGRMIDADALIKRISELVRKAETDGFDLGAAWYKAFIRHIELAPTIVTAEQEEP